MTRVKQLTSADSSPENINRLIDELEKQMVTASRQLEFERAAQLRDQILELQDFLERQEKQNDHQSPRKPAPKEKPTATKRTRGPNKPNPEAVAALVWRFMWWIRNRDARKARARSGGKE